MLSAVAALREATGSDHDAVDAAFGGFDLKTRAGYAAFLIAHARALPAVEEALAAIPAFPAPRPRTDLLAVDLAALGEPMPDPLPFALTDHGAAAWGTLYVIEGSRLGGIMLARSVADGWQIGRAHV